VLLKILEWMSNVKIRAISVQFVVKFVEQNICLTVRPGQRSHTEGSPVRTRVNPAGNRVHCPYTLTHRFVRCK
jgi:hypothetical protein